MTKIQMQVVMAIVRILVYKYKYEVQLEGSTSATVWNLEENGYSLGIIYDKKLSYRSLENFV